MEEVYEWLFTLSTVKATQSQRGLTWIFFFSPFSYDRQSERKNISKYSVGFRLILPKKWRSFKCSRTEHSFRVKP